MVRIRAKMSCSCKTVNAPIVDIQIQKDGYVPTYARDGDAGADLRSAEDLVYIGPGERKLINTGISIALPYGYVALIHPRSGLALKNGITVLNTPGTIDSGYRGEIGVILYNSGAEPFTVQRGDRIAQMVVQKFETVEFNKVDALTESDRGQSGFGSTGN
jgi:dUTP pyrophosphatase